MVKKEYIYQVTLFLDFLLGTKYEHLLLIQN